jgi:hypothetical protein
MMKSRVVSIVTILLAASAARASIHQPAFIEFPFYGNPRVLNFHVMEKACGSARGGDNVIETYTRGTDFL